MKKMLSLELTLMFAILQSEKRTANDKQCRSKFSAGQDCSKAVSSCQYGQHATARPTRHLSSCSLPQSSSYSSIERSVKVPGTQFSWGWRKQTHISNDIVCSSGVAALPSPNAQAPHFSISTTSSCYLFLSIPL